MKDAVCAIDIGSTVCRILVGRPLSDGSVEVIGAGSAPSRGVRNGAIVNIEQTIQSIGEAAREAELMSGMVVDEALVNITGKHLKGENSRGVVAITNRDRIVTEGDVLRVIEGAQNIRIPADQEILHVLSREFSVDDQGAIRDPVGMTGVRLEAEVHIVTAGITALSNLNKAVSGAGIRLVDGVMSSLASAEAVLGDQEKEMGAAVIDIGGGIVDIIAYIEGGVYFSSIVPIGGIHVTQDLSIGLKIPLESAEMIKKTYGSANIGSIDPVERIEVPPLPGRPGRSVLRQNIAEIIEPRMREIFELVDAELVRSGKKSSLAGGLILTGGGSQLEGAVHLAEETIGLVCAQGIPSGISGFTERVSSPEFSTAVGLLLYGARNTEKIETDRMAGGTVLDRLKKWFQDNI